MNGTRLPLLDVLSDASEDRWVFESVYEQEPCVVKVERRTSPQIPSEVANLQKLAGICGVPTILDHQIRQCCLLALKPVGRALTALQLVPKEVNDICRQIFQVLASAHARGVVHLDVSPDNIILTESNNAILVDWGVAVATGTPVGFVGKPCFASARRLGCQDTLAALPEEDFEALLHTRDFLLGLPRQEYCCEATTAAAVQATLWTQEGLPP